MHVVQGGLAGHHDDVLMDDAGDLYCGMQVWKINMSFLQGGGRDDMMVYRMQQVCMQGRLIIKHVAAACKQACCSYVNTSTVIVTVYWAILLYY